MYADEIKHFAESLKQVYALPGRAQPEDQLKNPVAALFTSIGEHGTASIETTTETALQKIGVRPDIAVYADGLVNGHIELKAPGKGANPKAFTTPHDKAQWKKMQSLPNLIYTDGRNWTLWRRNPKAKESAAIRLEPVKQVAFEGDPVTRGADAISEKNIRDLSNLFETFLAWAPLPPSTVTELAGFLAPLAKLMREEVSAALEIGGSALRVLSDQWRRELMPGLDDGQFADAYAQTVVYASTLAAFEDPQAIAESRAPRVLEGINPVLSEALTMLSNPKAQTELKTSYPLLKRYLKTMRRSQIKTESADLWLYFYETFLAEYDPKLRKNYGVYYTPVEVVDLQVRLVDELLRTKFARTLGFADESVTVLDPAVGTGTYPVAVARHALDAVKDYGPGQMAETARLLAKNIHGFEILVGPYSVAHLRLRETLLAPLRRAAEEAGQDPNEATLNTRINIYLANTLESPNVTPTGALSLSTQSLVAEHDAAQSLKRDRRILVCIGNPPYDRQQKDSGENEDDIRRKGGWVRFGDQLEGGAKLDAQGERPILRDFLDPASAAGQGVHLKNVYNDYVYFWRWALWRLFEQQEGGGIVSFITASSYLAGPGFVGMREKMRREFDEIYVIDLGGDNLGTRKTPNVFQITVPVAICVGYRAGDPNPDTPADVHYVRLRGDTRGEKLAKIRDQGTLAEMGFQPAAAGWLDPFLPEGEGRYFDWPKLADLFPWQHSGAQFKRSWPISENRTTLQKRLEKLINSNFDSTLFKDTRDRKAVNLTQSDFDEVDIGRYAYRTYDRQYAIVHSGVGDYLRAPLLNSRSGNQIYFSSLLNIPFSVGQAINVSALLPDMDNFRGSFGAKHVLPLYRDAAATQPNVTTGLLPFYPRVMATRSRQRIWPPMSMRYWAGRVIRSAFGMSLKRRVPASRLQPMRPCSPAWPKPDARSFICTVTVSGSDLRQACRMGRFHNPVVWETACPKPMNMTQKPESCASAARCGRPFLPPCMNLKSRA